MPQDFGSRPDADAVEKRLDNLVKLLLVPLVFLLSERGWKKDGFCFHLLFILTDFYCNFFPLHEQSHLLVVCSGLPPNCSDLVSSVQKLPTEHN